LNTKSAESAAALELGDMQGHGGGLLRCWQRWSWGAQPERIGRGLQGRKILPAPHPHNIWHEYCL